MSILLSSNLFYFNFNSRINVIRYKSCIFAFIAIIHSQTEYVFRTVFTTVASSLDKIVGGLTVTP